MINEVNDILTYDLDIEKPLSFDSGELLDDELRNRA